MLIEIQSDVFRTEAKDGPIRPTIKFKKGLNVINGSVTGTNSIGKSTFMMAIDFCFGGKGYAKLENVKNNIGIHDINFAFKFDSSATPFYFSRNTGEPTIVNVCNSSYEKTEEKWSLDEFNKWLNDQYNNATLLSFRDTVSLYSRIANRENLDAIHPLRYFNGQSDGDSIIKLLKLYNLFDPIIDSEKDAKLASEKKTAFSDAQKYDFIPKITKAKRDNNLKRIAELEQQKEDLANKSEKGLLELSSSQADAISKLKADLSVFKRQRGKLYNKIDILKKDKNDNKEVISKDFEELQYFFPNIQLKRITDVEDYHKEISSIMNRQIAESEKKTWNLINLLNEQINVIEQKIAEISSVKNVSKVTLDTYSGLDKEINQLKLENEKFEKQNEIIKESKETAEKLSSDTMEQSKKLEGIINPEMNKINSKIFGSNVNTPEFHIETSKRYSFYTPNDDGTGTTFKGLVVMDIATLLTTSLPILIHDSVVLKQISNESIEKIFEIYDNLEKQVFISIDKDTSYTDETVKIIRKDEVLKLSSGGNELYGFQFTLKGNEKDD